MPRRTRAELLRRDQCPAIRRDDRGQRDAAHANYRRCIRQAKAARTVRPVAVAALTPGTVGWACVPFAENSAFKTRPVLVLEVTRDMVVCLPMSRRKLGRRLITLPDDMPFLSYPSAIMPRIVRITLTDFRFAIGTTTAANLAVGRTVAETLQAVAVRARIAS
jgi:hypothetical protein